MKEGRKVRMGKSLEMGKESTPPPRAGDVPPTYSILSSAHSRAEMQNLEIGHVVGTEGF